MVEPAREQALRYVRALPVSELRPPFVVVVDVGFSIDLYSNFAGVGDSYVLFPDSGKFRVLLPALADPEVRARLKLLFTDPQQLDPARLAAQVTRRLAGHLTICTLTSVVSCPSKGTKASSATATAPS
jgi:hypothetical protein